MTVILDRRAAAGGGDDDRVEAASLDLADPDIDIGTRRGERLFFAAHVVNQGAAASLAFRHDDLDAQARQQPNGRLVDSGIENRLRATGQDRDAAVTVGLRLMTTGPGERRLCRNA